MARLKSEVPLATPAHHIGVSCSLHHQLNATFSAQFGFEISPMLAKFVQFIRCIFTRSPKHCPDGYQSCLCPVLQLCLVVQKIPASGINQARFQPKRMTLRFHVTHASRKIQYRYTFQMKPVRLLLYTVIILQWNKTRQIHHICWHIRIRSTVISSRTFVTQNAYKSSLHSGISVLEVIHNTLQTTYNDGVHYRSFYNIQSVLPVLPSITDGIH